MIDGLYYFRDINFASVFLRMFLAVICSGIIGIEREYKRRPAGFRTHILICLGACITSLTGQYLSINLHYSTDMSRLGAQVVAGIGFIGAGAIIMTPKNQVRGLTTSAGLWTCAIIGLCFGGGFYEGGILATFLILLSEMVFSKLEYWLTKRMPKKIIYIEYSSDTILDRVFSMLREKRIEIESIQLSRGENTGDYSLRSAVIYLESHSIKVDNAEFDSLFHDFENMDGIETLEII